MPGLHEAYRRHARYYLQVAQTLSSNYNALRGEYPQVRSASQWLATQRGTESAGCLLELIRTVSPYLLATSNNEELLDLCNHGTSASQRLGENVSWLELLKAECYYARGEWDRGLAAARIAVERASGLDPKTYAHAMLAMGRMQLNAGNYNEALRTLKIAQDLLTDLDDREGLATAVAEFAAYQLNRGKNEKALELYQEADRIRGRTESRDMTDHSLLMMGVVYRKLGRSNEALEYLRALQSRGESDGTYSKVATAMHHIAWVHLQDNCVAEARQFAERARELYLQIKDPRGVSDVDEQLGMVCLLEGKTTEAKQWLHQSIAARRRLGNRQGIASSFNRLAMVFFRERQWLIGGWYLGRSLWLYTLILRK